MKTITIGRGEGCDIFIDDSRISRRHALIKIFPFGKMEIVDLGQNGTWVNGVKLKPNVPFPVKRRDVVNFAETSKLNWSKVPNPLKPYKIGAAILCLIIVIIVIIITTLRFFSCENSKDIQTNNPVTEEIVTNPSPMDDPASLNEEVGTVIPSQQSKKGDDVTKKTVDELFPHKNDKKKDEEKDKKKEKGKTKSSTDSADDSDHIDMY